MLKQLEKLKLNARQELDAINTLKELESWRVRYLGKKSELTGMLRNLATLPIEQRKAVGASANEVKTSLEDSLKQKEQALHEVRLAASAEETGIDTTLPGRPLPIGHLVLIFPAALT